MTFKDLKNFVEIANVKYEIRPSYSETLSGNKFIIGYIFSMNNIYNRQGRGEYQWVHYKSISDKPLSDDTNMYFIERYSQVNGRAYHGWKEERRIWDYIDKKLGKY